VKERGVLKLYMHPYSTYSRRVRIALLEKNLPCELVTVDMAARKHREPEYLALNPYGRVPTLVDDDFVLYESTAILNYLEAKYPQPALVPSDLRGRAQVDLHMKLCDVQFTRQCGTIVFPKRFLPKERWDEKAFEQARGEIDKHLAILNRQLGDREFLVGESYSLADVCYTPWLGFFELMGVKAQPAIAKWSARLLARKSAVETAPAQ
jgi:glutathione S-transferase